MYIYIYMFMFIVYRPDTIMTFTHVLQPLRIYGGLTHYYTFTVKGSERDVRVRPMREYASRSATL